MNKKDKKQKAIVVSFSTDKKTTEKLDTLVDETGLNRSLVLSRLINKGKTAQILQP